MYPFVSNQNARGKAHRTSFWAATDEDRRVDYDQDVRPRRRADWELSDEPDRKIARPAVRDSSPQRSHRAPRSAAFSPDRSPIRGRERAIKYPSAKEPTETWRSSSPPRGGVNDTRERDPWSALEEEMQSIVMKKVTDAVVPKAAEERIPLRGEDRSVSDWRRIRDEPLEPRGKLEDSARGGNFSYSARNGREDSRSSRASVGEGKLVNVWRELDRMKREDREAYDLLLNVVEASKDPTFTLVDAFLESDRSPQRRVRSPDRQNRGGSPRRSFSASNPDRRAKPAVSGDFTNSFSSRREEPSDRFRAAAGRHQSYEETPVPALASVPPPSQLRGESWRNLSSHKPEDTPKGEVWRRPNESTGGSWRTAAEPVSFDSWRNVDKNVPSSGTLGSAMQSLPGALLVRDVGIDFRNQQYDETPQSFNRSDRSFGSSSSRLANKPEPWSNAALLKAWSEMNNRGGYGRDERGSFRGSGRMNRGGYDRDDRDPFRR